ncbi:MAG: hypothetical protein BRC33_02810 [Cyanobacteria bacterium SW_9_44_58]|nr:MAG: hypothetical protein BRC33_02810 [Cyanobacteria bacterium SW_9_44_58]
MYKRKVPIETTGVIDRELITYEALLSMKKQLDHTYLPLTIEHDIRNPPVGRIVSAEIVKLEDGNYLLEGEAEVFESTDDLSKIKDTSKSIRTYSEDIETFQISCDDRGSTTEIDQLRKEIEPLASNSLDYRRYSFVLRSRQF